MFSSCCFYCWYRVSYRGKSIFCSTSREFEHRIVISRGKRFLESASSKIVVPRFNMVNIYLAIYKCI